ncbi:MAG: hypothetical protein UHS54_04020 [Lachnospiraceae bacterium]|nr:hypothetical protein [Lachnospiraceae bacterium]
MTLMLELKEKIRTVYRDFSYIILPILKFLLAFATFYSINETIGFMSVFKNIFVLLIMALICCLLPVNAIVVFAGVMILGHCYALGIIVAAFALVLLIVSGTLFLRFAAKDSLALVLTPFAFALGVPCVVPLCYGLKRKPSSAVAVVCGTVVYYFMEFLKEKSSALKGSDNSEMLTKLKLLLDGLVKNQGLLIYILAFVIVLLLVYVIRRTGKDYVWHVAIVTGAITYLAIVLCGGLFMNIRMNVAAVVVGTAGAAIIAVLYGFFVHNVDYSRTERLEFEDDEYYYYVKAVPKMTISQAQREIKTISGEQEELQAGVEPFGESREMADINEEDLERKLEESLKNL